MRKFIVSIHNCRLINIDLFVIRSVIFHRFKYQRLYKVKKIFIPLIIQMEAGRDKFA